MTARFLEIGVEQARPLARHGGLEVDEVAAAIDGGLSSWRLLCPSCAAVAQN